MEMMMKLTRTIYISRESQNDEGIQTLKAIGKCTVGTTKNGAIEITYDLLRDRVRGMEWYLRWCCENHIPCNGVV